MGELGMVPKLLQTQREKGMAQAGEKVTSPALSLQTSAWAELRGHFPLIHTKPETQLPKFLFPHSSAI